MAQALTGACWLLLGGQPGGEAGTPLAATPQQEARAGGGHVPVCASLWV